MDGQIQALVSFYTRKPKGISPMYGLDDFSVLPDSFRY